MNKLVIEPFNLMCRFQTQIITVWSCVTIHFYRTVFQNYFPSDNICVCDKIIMPYTHAVMSDVCQALI